MPGATQCCGNITENESMSHLAVSAIVFLSGEQVTVGASHMDVLPCNTVFIKTRENAEPIVMSTTEAKLLIAGLKAAVEEAKRTE